MRKRPLTTITPLIPVRSGYNRRANYTCFSVKITISSIFHASFLPS